MSETTLPEYLSVESVLQSAELSVTPAELHGLLAGMLSGGMSLNDTSWQPLIFDYTSDGMAWTDRALRIADDILKVTTSELTGTGMEMSLLLPDEDKDLLEFADALSDWVNHFISGLGLINVSLKDMPEDVKEALGDLEEIGKLGIDEDDDMDEQADLLEQVIEHVKACVLTIHAQYGVKAEKDSQPTIH
ncbi:YecA family protein [Vibrio sp. JC009]|uniref:YecA/YgfB family protein n=1 Tax=Vibrio sp. JC009 TaxID=2912314 RepID=UPI0023B2061D|nr:YecA family protein [Vibrio sp. JC009]WED22230.1 YecA family protein [Vibrio sp. JC009]